MHIWKWFVKSGNLPSFAFLCKIACTELEQQTFNGCGQGVTKRCRQSWLTSPRIWAQMRRDWGGGGVAGSQPVRLCSVYMKPKLTFMCQKYCISLPFTFPPSVSVPVSQPSTFTVSVLPLYPRTLHFIHGWYDTCWGSMSNGQYEYIYICLFLPTYTILRAIG